VGSLREAGPEVEIPKGVSCQCCWNHLGVYLDHLDRAISASASCETHRNTMLGVPCLGGGSRRSLGCIPLLRHHSPLTDTASLVDQSSFRHWERCRRSSTSLPSGLPPSRLRELPGSSLLRFASILEPNISCRQHPTRSEFSPFLKASVQFFHAIRSANLQEGPQILLAKGIPGMQEFAT